MLSEAVSAENIFTDESDDGTGDTLAVTNGEITSVSQIIFLAILRTLGDCTQNPYEELVIELFADVDSTSLKINK